MSAVWLGTLILAVAVVVLAALAWQRGGWPLVGNGLNQGKNLILEIAPLLITCFLAVGLAQVLLPRESIAGWLGQEAGWRGIILGSLMGAITPGGPYVVIPLAAGMFKAGAGIGTVVAFITGWSVLAVGRLPYELPFLGPRVLIIRILSSLLLAPLAGGIAQFVLGRFPRGNGG